MLAYITLYVTMVTDVTRGHMCDITSHLQMQGDNKTTCPFPGDNPGINLKLTSYQPLNPTT